MVEIREYKILVNSFELLVDDAELDKFFISKSTFTANNIWAIALAWSMVLVVIVELATPMMISMAKSNARKLQKTENNLKNELA